MARRKTIIKCHCSVSMLGVAKISKADTPHHQLQQQPYTHTQTPPLHADIFYASLSMIWLMQLNWNKGMPSRVKIRTRLAMWMNKLLHTCAICGSEATVASKSQDVILTWHGLQSLGSFDDPPKYCSTWKAVQQMLLDRLVAF